MVSRRRMKIDTLIQSMLLVAVILGWLLLGWSGWLALPLLGLLCLQMISAMQLWSVYRFQPAHSFLWVGAAILLVFVIAWFNWGLLSWILPLGLVLAYYFQTIQRLVIVLRRPRSFWDLI